MNVLAIRRLRAKLLEGQPTYGLWITLEAPSITEMAVAVGIDWVAIDAEHGHLDWKEIAEHLRTTVRSETVALVRIAERSTSLAKRALDIGADGIVIPWAETVEQIQEAIRDCRYPPEGRRGVGGERATVWGQSLREHTREANDHALVVPILETAAGIARAAELSRVEGTELFFFGPADHSASVGFRGQWEGPGVAAQILQAKETLHSAGKHCGLMTLSEEDLQLRRSQGFQMLALGSDVGLLGRSLHRALRSVDRDCHPATSLDSKEALPITDPIPQPPIAMRPDREERVVTKGEGQSIVFQPGVAFEALAGAATQLRSLTTGIVTLEPLAVLDLHTHPCSESITVLEGEVEITVDGRTYQLARYDNLVVPRWLPHTTRNPQPHAKSRLHAALAMAPPAREPSAARFESRPMPSHSTGVPGFELVTRFDAATRELSVGVQSEFIDYFNAKRIPGIEMSGGFGWFQPGGRLPAHVHDFDESICIVEGAATCIVEGRRYLLTDCATATVPRGRVHYFVNESPQPMAMIWVYAGPLPLRIVVDERCATLDSNPWK